MSSVPPLPGYQVRKPKQEHNPRLQTLQWKKGVPLSAPTTGPPRADEIELDDIFNKEYSLRFGDKRHLPAKQSRFLPKWAIYEKKVLQFSGYFTESLDEDKKDVFRVHQIIFRYHLLDDTISIHEPKTANSGLIQGLLLKRQRVPRPVTRGGTLAEEGEGRQSPNERFWHWSDLNRGVTVDVYGRKYILCDCDEFTKEFLLSEGSELNPPLEVPPDPYETLRESRKETPQRSSDLRGISGMSGSRIIFKDLILKFHVMVEEDLDGKKSKATSAALSYRMSDGKIEIRKSLPYEDYEIKRFSPIMLKWSKVPLEVAGKAGAANVGEEEEFGVEHLTPVHLAPPITVSVFGRKVLVTGCDEQTSNILEQLYGVKGTPVLSRQIEEKPKLSSARVTSDILARPRPKQGILSEEDCKV